MSPPSGSPLLRYPDVRVCVCAPRRAVLAACSHYFQAMFSGGLRESLDKDVNFRDSIHPEVPAPPCPPSLPRLRL